MKDKNIVTVSESDNSIKREKIKAIYPHIVVNSDTNKPYYTIHWYDMNDNLMHIGYGSYNLEFVKTWLQEDFEDINSIITQQQMEIERLQARCENTQVGYNFAKAEIERLQSILDKKVIEFTYDKKQEIKSEARKEFAERIKDDWFNNGYNSPDVDFDDFVDNIVKEMDENNGH